MLLNDYQTQALRTDGDDAHYAKSELAHALNELDPIGDKINEYFTNIQYYGDLIDQAKKKLVYKTRATDAEGINENKINKLRSFHALMLLTSEVAELSAGIYSEDGVNVAEELGDIMWGVSLLAKSYGLTLEQCAKANIAKLSARYPGKFSVESALNRDKAAENEAVIREITSAKKD
jgi:NTP pyrophosphatase (non-canonical NTP hydrolase)